LKRIIIESPYNPQYEQIVERAKWMVDGRSYWDRFMPNAPTQLLRENILYCRLLYKKALEEGHAPFASHLNYTQVWSEDHGFRERGIAAGFAWGDVADLFWYGVDLGWSPGMLASLEKHGDRSVRIPLFPDWDVVQVRAHLASLPFEAFIGVT